MDQDALAEIGVTSPIAEEVARLASLSYGAGADGIVCSPQEAAQMRELLGPDALHRHPGACARGLRGGDQKRIATPGGRHPGRAPPSSSSAAPSPPPTIRWPPLTPSARSSWPRGFSFLHKTDRLAAVFENSACIAAAKWANYHSAKPTECVSAGQRQSSVFDVWRNHGSTPAYRRAAQGRPREGCPGPSRAR